MMSSREGEGSLEVMVTKGMAVESMEEGAKVAVMVEALTAGKSKSSDCHRHCQAEAKGN
jgi:predicted Fe-Mo cluster-binding NifX family protein